MKQAQELVAGRTGYRSGRKPCQAKRDLMKPSPVTVILGTGVSLLPGQVAKVEIKSPVHA